MIRVITIDREYGSGGPDIARKLSERLGWKLWDQLLTNEIARLMDCDAQIVQEREERKDPLRYRLFKSFMRGSLEGSLNAPRLGMVDAECIREVTEKIVTEAAKTGNSIIVGRGSPFYLHGHPDVFHVFIYAPIEEKVRRLQQAGRSDAEAHELAETVDRDRAAYIKQHFDLEWPSRDLFHLMVNSVIGDERVVETILDALAVLEKRTV